jgi:hypothetical protein
VNPRPILAGLVLSFAAATGANAQPTLARADSLLRAGAVAEAEALLYGLASWRPRDPFTRLALGRYIAARGAPRVGAVLIEEARRFGLAPEVAANHLGPLYERLGDYASLSRLEPSPVPPSERPRVRWLATNAAGVSGPDSTVVAVRGGSSTSLFVLPMVLRGDTIWVDVLPGVQELTIDAALARSLVAELFGGEREGRRLAVLRELRVGALRLTNVPATFEQGRGGRRGRVGIDFLRRLAPTYDPFAGSVVLRRSGRAPLSAAPMEPLPVLHEAHALFLVLGGRLQPLFAEGPTRLLKARRWTWDARRGEIRVE